MLWKTGGSLLYLASPALACLCAGEESALPKVPLLESDDDSASLAQLLWPSGGPHTSSQSLSERHLDPGKGCLSLYAGTVWGTGTPPLLTNEAPALELDSLGVMNSGSSIYWLGDSGKWLLLFGPQFPHL